MDLKGKGRENSPLKTIIKGKENFLLREAEIKENRLHQQKQALPHQSPLTHLLYVDSVT
jgi:hypothetical protein